MTINKSSYNVSLFFNLSITRVRQNFDYSKYYSFHKFSLFVGFLNTGSYLFFMGWFLLAGTAGFVSGDVLSWWILVFSLFLLLLCHAIRLSGKSWNKVSQESSLMLKWYKHENFSANSQNSCDINCLSPSLFITSGTPYLPNNNFNSFKITVLLVISGRYITSKYIINWNKSNFCPVQKCPFLLCAMDLEVKL